MAMQIQWRRGFRAAQGVRPEDVYSELEAIREENGTIAPAVVVDRARAPDSPMHNQFEWDDGVAAQAYRVTQARHMIRSIQVVREDAPGPAVPEYTAVTVTTDSPDGEPEKSYQSTTIALRDPIQRDEILANAIREALAFRRKYAALQELAQVNRAIDSTLEEIAI